MKRYSTLLLDADGTLLDFDQAEEIALRTVYGRHGIPCTKENLNTYFKVNQALWKQLERNEITKEELIQTRFPITFDQLHLKVSTSASFSKEYQEELAKQHPLLEGALEAVKELSKDYVLAIVTNGNLMTQQARLKDSGLKDWMSRIFISDELGVQKPMKAFFDRVLAELEEKDPSKILVVGDSLSSDILGARNAGLDSCWINLKKEVSLKTEKPTWEIASIRELVPLLKRLEIRI